MARARGLTWVVSKNAAASPAQRPSAAVTRKMVKLRIIAHPLYLLSRVATTTGAVLVSSSPVVVSTTERCRMYMPAGTRS